MAITGWREFPAFVGGDGPLRPGIEWGELSGLVPGRAARGHGVFSEPKLRSGRRCALRIAIVARR